VTFLTPLSAIFAAALAIPALLILYFLKLRRYPVRIASTLLWRKSVEDLQVNAPFQRLRVSLLFLLQLLALLLFLLALARPVIDAERSASRHTIILIDHSASMQAIDDRVDTTDSEPVTRLDRAKDAARDVIDRLARSDEPHETMVIAFAHTAGVVSAFDANRSALLAAIDSIPATHEPANLAAAIKLANAYAARTADETTSLPNVILISDGSVQTLDAGTEPENALQAGSVEYVRIGPGPADRPLDNIGFIAVSARRKPDDPATVEVFARVASINPQHESISISVRVDGRAATTRRIDMPALERERQSAPAEVATTFELDIPYGGVVTLFINRDDDLAADNRAALIIPPPARPRIVVVSPDAQVNPFIRTILGAIEPEDLRATTPKAFEAIGANESESGGHPVDLVIFDGASPTRIPRSASVTFGGAPPRWVVREPLREGAQRFLSWDRNHPIMRHVELDETIFASFGGYSVPDEDRDRYSILASGRDGPVIVSTRVENRVHVFIGFDLLRSNWPAQVSFAVFMRNVLDQTVFALGAAGMNEGRALSPGDAAQVQAAPGAEAIEIEGPAASRVLVNDRSRLTLPAFRLAGIYRIRGAREEDQTIAVNLTNVDETDIRPRPEVSLNATDVRGIASSRSAPREIWPWLIAAALGLLTLEWIVYSARARVL